MERSKLLPIHEKLIVTLQLSDEQQKILIDSASSPDDIPYGLFVLSKGEQRKLIIRSFPDLDLETIAIAKALAFKKRQLENSSNTRV